MDLTSPSAIKKLLLKHGARPQKTMGQNFLVDKNILQKIIKCANLNKNDVVLEIGAGIGNLTEELAKSAKTVIAAEKDRLMCEILKETLKDYKNVEIVNDDILKIKSWNSIKNYKIISNLPYYIASPVIRKFLEEKNQPELMVLMVQKEVAQRICSKPPNMSLLAVSVQYYAKPEIIAYVLRNCFWPVPKVDSAIIKIVPGRLTSQGLGRQTSPDLFFKIVKAGFSQPRKQLGNNLSKMLKLKKEMVNSWLLKNNIKPSQRAETLNINDWIDLTNTLKKISTV